MAEIDFEAEGLLEGLDGDGARVAAQAARGAGRRRLRARRAARGRGAEPAALLPVETRARAASRKYTADEVAEKTRSGPRVPGAAVERAGHAGRRRGRGGLHQGRRATPPRRPGDPRRRPARGGLLEVTPRDEPEHGHAGRRGRAARSATRLHARGRQRAATSPGATPTWPRSIAPHVAAAAGARLRHPAARGAAAGDGRPARRRPRASMRGQRGHHRRVRRPGRLHPPGREHRRPRSWARWPRGWASWPPRWPSRRCASSRRSATPRCWCPTTPTRVIKATLALVDAAEQRGRGLPPAPRRRGRRPRAAPRAGDCVRAAGEPGQPDHRQARPGSVLASEDVKERAEERLQLVVRPQAQDQGPDRASVPLFRRVRPPDAGRRDD